MDTQVPLRVAARSAGVPERTVRNWVTSGKLAAMRGERGYLVRIADVKRVAAIAGREAATSPVADESAAPVAAETAVGLPIAEQEERAVAMIQRAFDPLVEELGRLREELGREKALREAAERERDELREQVRRARSIWSRLFGGES